MEIQPHTPSLTCLSGGEFRRQADVTFQPGGERFTISQEFKGIDEHDHLMVETRLEGKIPELPEGATVQINPYTEIYQYSTNCESDRHDCMCMHKTMMSMHNNTIMYATIKHK